MSKLIGEITAGDRSGCDGDVGVGVWPWKAGGSARPENRRDRLIATIRLQHLSDHAAFPLPLNIRSLWRRPAVRSGRDARMEHGRREALECGTRLTAILSTRRDTRAVALAPTHIGARVRHPVQIDLQQHAAAYACSRLVRLSTRPGEWTRTPTDCCINARTAQCPSHARLK